MSRPSLVGLALRYLLLGPLLGGCTPDRPADDAREAAFVAPAPSVTVEPIPLPTGGSDTTSDASDEEMDWSKNARFVPTGPGCVAPIVPKSAFTVRRAQVSGGFEQIREYRMDGTVLERTLGANGRTTHRVARLSAERMQRLVADLVSTGVLSVEPGCWHLTGVSLPPRETPGPIDEAAMLKRLREWVPNTVAVRHKGRVYSYAYNVYAPDAVRSAYAIMTVLDAESEQLDWNPPHTPAAPRR